jgi:hypothetical protein
VENLYQESQGAALDTAYTSSIETVVKAWYDEVLQTI